MKNNLIYKISITISLTILIIFAVILNARFVRTATVDKFFDIQNSEAKDELIINFLKNLDNASIETIGISKSDIINENLSNINANITSKSADNYYIILHNTNPYNDKDYITIFKRGLFFYKHIGTPIEFNNVIDVFLLKTKGSNDYILFTRDLIGFETSPLDLVVNLNAFVYDKYKNDFVNAIEIIENIEQYEIVSNDNKNMYKKSRSKSDIMLTNSNTTIVEILTHDYEAISEEFNATLSKTPPYNLSFDVIKTSNNYSKYFYDPEFNHFLLGYLQLNDTNEIVGIIKFNKKIINNNFKNTYTIIKKNGEIFEIFDNFTILNFN